MEWRVAAVVLFCSVTVALYIWLYVDVNLDLLNLLQKAKTVNYVTEGILKADPRLLNVYKGMIPRPGLGSEWGTLRLNGENVQMEVEINKSKTVYPLSTLLGKGYLHFLLNEV